MNTTDDVIITDDCELHIAVALSHLGEAKRLLSQDHDLVHQIDNNGDQPLHLAARIGSCDDVVKLLIEFDAPLGKLDISVSSYMCIAKLMIGRKDSRFDHAQPTTT